MSKIKFTLGATSWTASCSRVYPVSDPVNLQVVTGYTDGGQLYAYDKGVAEQLFTLVFDKLVDSDDAALRAFHQTVAVGPINPFIYTDEAGVEHTVRWLDTRYPISKSRHNYYAGTIQLREEIAG